ncbi:hypothetical protein [Zhengella mangrovi]|uniref:hypothetical protein n=1 Tax=Zhengella mangrovi TaxID=1982044 RepID=UPI001FE065F9|nr:hypothetical protein [Zhengella mangrovi]
MIALDTMPDLPATASISDENLRLIGGGNDLFVTVGIGMLFAGILFSLQALPAIDRTIGAVIVAVLIWAVAEFVTRQKRMRLASTVLGIGFVAGIGVLLGDHVSSQAGLEQLNGNLVTLFALRSKAGWLGSLAAGGVAGAAALYFWRFRVPIMAAIIALAMTAMAFLWVALLLYDGVTSGQVALPTSEQLPMVMERALLVPLACGVIVFLVAVALDLHDRERFTIWSDCAFWLHVVSAPMLVHPLFILATGQATAVGTIEPGAGAAISLGLLIAGFVYVALAIDRRSLLVPTFAYFGSIGVYYLFDHTANATGIPPFALILLMIGALVIMFGAGWQRIRGLTVGSTLPTSVLAKLPPIKV